MVHLRYRFRIYPTVAQQQSLSRGFGCCRVVYNDAIELREEAFKAGKPYPSDSEVCRKVITEAKRKPERSWLSEVSTAALQQAVRDANRAYRDYFASKLRKRKGAALGKPRYKSRRDRRQSMRFARNAKFRITSEGRLRLTGIGEVKVVWSRGLPSEPSSVTVIRDSAGRYFASFVCEVRPEPKPQTQASIGIDLGLASFVTTSDGQKIEPPRLLRRAERALSKAHRSMSRKQPGSANRERARQNLARRHAAVADARRDFLHRLSTTLVNENQVIVVEDLCVQAIANSHLAKSVRDAGWGMFVRALEYKAALYGRELIKLDRYFPSSQTCSVCWAVTGSKPLGVRAWTCPHCNAHQDRDINAAKAILAAGLAERQNGCGAGEDLEAHPRGQALAQPQARPPAGDCEEAAISAALRPRRSMA